MKANMEDTNDAIALKSDLTYVDASLNLKADINNPNFTGDVSMNNKLRVGSDASFNGDVTITGNLEVKQQQDTFIINTTVNDYTLIVTEDLSLNGDLRVSGDASFNNHVTIPDLSATYIDAGQISGSAFNCGGTISAQTFSIGGAGVISGSRQISCTDIEMKDNDGNITLISYGDTGNTTIKGTLDIDTINETTVNAGVTIEGILLKDGHVTPSGISSNGTISAQTFSIGGSGVISATKQISCRDIEMKDNGGNITLISYGDTGNTTIQGTLEVNNDVSFNNGLSVGGDVSLNGRVDICGNFYAQYPNNSIPISAIIGDNENKAYKDLVDASLNLKADLTYVDASFNYVTTAINNEITRATNAEETNATNIASKADKDLVDASFNLKADINNAEFTGDVSFNAGLRFGGDIIPTTDSAFDIGTPDLKVRDLYLSNNSLWIGNDHKIDIQDGKMKFRKRKASVIPASVKTAKNDTDENILSDIKTTIGLDESYTTVSQITPGMYLRYARKKGNLTVNNKTGDNITVQDIYGTDVADYEDIQNSDITKEKLSLNDRLTVAKDVSFNSKLFVNGDISLNGGLFIPDKSINVAALKNNSDTTNKTFVITAGGGVYSIDDVTQDTLLLYRGLKYVFDVNDSSVSSHPFYIQTTSGTYTSSNVYNEGVTNNGATSGTIEFIIPNDAPNTLYYVCGSHSDMGGTINIQNGLNINDNLIVKETIQHNGLTMTPGTGVDQIIEFTNAPTFTANQWFDLHDGANYSGPYIKYDGSTATSNVAYPSTYIMQLYIQSSGNFDLHASGNITFGNYPTADSDGNTEEIVLHRGYYKKANVWARMKYVNTNSINEVRMQIKVDTSVSSLDDYKLTLRRFM